ncbi:MAG: SDR family NAD(P)-dependent oxidoreductase [Sphaerochaetaceae bacterium]|nr:SDR family NAD(P)-dependent oxidoreductase [Sphaerochaetaceae bacterium]
MDKTIIITGATSGIGYETAKKLFLEGYHLVLGNRNNEKAKKLKNELLSLKDGKIDLLEIDLSSFSSIRNFANEVINNYEKIDVLINNAGTFSRTNSYTVEKFEMTLGVNYLGTYLLTELLLQKLLENKKAKIIIVSSIGCYFGRIKLNSDFFFTKKNNFLNYFNSKLACLHYAKHLQENYPNLVIKAADPGVAYSNIWKWKTGFGKSLDKLYKKLFKSSKEAARVIIQLASTETFDLDQNLLYKYNESSKLPRKLKKQGFTKSIIDFTEEILKHYI